MLQWLKNINECDSAVQIVLIGILSNLIDYDIECQHVFQHKIHQNAHHIHRRVLSGMKTNLLFTTTNGSADPFFKKPISFFSKSRASITSNLITPYTQCRKIDRRSLNLTTNNCSKFAFCIIYIIFIIWMCLYKRLPWHKYRSYPFKYSMRNTFGIGYFKSNMLLSLRSGIVIRFGRTQNDAMTSPIAPRSMPLHQGTKNTFQIRPT